MPDFFLDSCIFFAYAYPHEPWHATCVTFFESRHNRYTGVRVRTEIEVRLKRRRQLYIDMVKHISIGCSPQEFVSSTIKNPNDLRHFKGILSNLTTEERADLVTYFRDKAEITKKGIEEAIGKINRHLVECTEDPMCVAVVETLVTNRADAQILVDALCWSETHPATFTTLDSTDIMYNKTRLISAICRYKLIDRANLSLGIAHIGDVI